MKTNVKNILLIAVMACVVALAGGNALAAEAKPNAITAIDILLEPDATMIQHATDTNDRLRKVFPKGFALDASHRPHVTLVQRFVRTKDLDKVYAAVGKVFAAANVTGLAPREYLDKMLAEPFETFTFSPAGAAVYHLGHFGTAAKKLKEWDLKP